MSLLCYMTHILNLGMHGPLIFCNAGSSLPMLNLVLTCYKIVSDSYIESCLAELNKIQGIYTFVQCLGITVLTNYSVDDVCKFQQLIYVETTSASVSFLNFILQATYYPGLCEPTTQGGLGFDYWANLSIPEMWLWHLENVPEREWSMNKVCMPSRLSHGIILLAPCRLEVSYFMSNSYLGSFCRL